MLREVGIEVADVRPESVTRNQLERADRVISLDCPLPPDLAEVAAGRLESWPMPDTAGKPVETVREIVKRIPDTHGEFPADSISSTTSSLSALSDLHPLGQIHESFIIAAGRDGLWIIDQHVAHERILFEKVLKQRAAGRVN